MYQSLPNTIDNFLNDVLNETLKATKLNHYTDNYDPIRTLIDRVDNSQVFQAGNHGFFYCWFFQNIEKIFSAYQMLQDEDSKRLYLYLISFRMAGHLSVRLPVKFSQSEIDEFIKIEGVQESDYQIGGSLGKLKHVDFNYCGEQYRGEFYSLEAYLIRKQYYYKNGLINIVPSLGDVVIDGGACTGDSAAVFSNSVGAQGEVWAFDPVKEHCDLMEKNVLLYNHKNVKVMPYGLSNVNIVAPPISINGFNPGFRVGGNEVPTRTLDSMFISGEIKTVNYIKMDIEGSELNAMNGALGVINRFKPKLAISLYHNPNDLFEIPLYLKQICPDYKFYLDHYTIHYDETVLYGVPA
jgi:FkbM family methyltransferase